jgi:hypothetical protein
VQMHNCQLFLFLSFAFAGLKIMRRKIRFIVCCRSNEQFRLVAQQQLALGDAAVNSPDADDQGSDEEFFCFSSGTTEHTDANVEVDLYLSDNCREIDSLHKFPLVKKVFEKYNTPLPTSVLVLEDKF